MSHCKSAGSVAAAVAFAIAAGSAGTAAADEVSELKAAVTALQQRIEQLESKTKEAVETNDRQTDLIAKTRNNVGDWVGRTTWSGDFRYRNENIEVENFPQQTTPTRDRNRDRIRARLGVVVRANDTLRAGVQLATAEGNDPRSSNQTLTGENTRKPITLDLAYAEWQPNATWRFTGGKMRVPWVRPGQSILFDGDVNPEGLAVNFTQGNFFASAFYNLLEERGAAGESTMVGGQAGYRWNISSLTRLTVGAGYYNLTGVEGKNPFFGGSSNGNTTTTLASVCSVGFSPCLLSDFTDVQGFAEFTTTVGKYPLALYVDYMNNTDAATDFDTAYSTGVLFGRASNPGTWEIGYVFQHVEKDAVYGQYVDSDFGGGNTDAEGSIFKLGYAFARNWAVNVSYFLNDTNIDVPVSLARTAVPALPALSVNDRSYKRLQVDLNVRY